MMQVPPDTHHVLLTASDIKKLEDDHARLTARIAEFDRQQKEIEQQKAAIERERTTAAAKLAKIRELLTVLGLESRLDQYESAQPAGASDTKTDPESEVDDEVEEEVYETNSPWAHEILNHLASGPYESLAYSQLRQKVMSGPMGEAFLLSDKGYYHAIRRMTRGGGAVKAYDRLFTSQGFRRYESDLASGLAKPFGPEISPTKSPVADAVVHYLGQRDEASAADIVAFLSSDSRFESIVRNKSAIFNVLKRLTERGQVIRHGQGAYALSPKNEAPSMVDEAPKNSLMTGETQTSTV